MNEEQTTLSPFQAREVRTTCTFLFLCSGGFHLQQWLSAACPTTVMQQQATSSEHLPEGATAFDLLVTSEK
jgi:hypothetical protein